MNSDSGQYLVFEASECSCAVPVRDVREIVRMPLLSRPPGMPRFLTGFLNLARESIPVVALGRLFDLPLRPTTLSTPIVVITSEGRSLGLLVCSVSRVVSVESSSMVPTAPQGTFKDCAVATMTHAGQLVHVLRPDCLLLAQERSCLDALEVIEQRRLAELEEVQS